MRCIIRQKEKVVGAVISKIHELYRPCPMLSLAMNNLKRDIKWQKRFLKREREIERERVTEGEKKE